MVITLFSWYQRDESNQNSHGTDKRTEDVLLFILSLAFVFSARGTPSQVYLRVVGIIAPVAACTVTHPVRETA